MSDNKDDLFIGDAKKINGHDAFVLTVNLNKLFAYLKNEAKEHIAEFTDKQGVLNKTIKFEVWPYKPENVNEFKTHFGKIRTFKPEKQTPPPPDLESDDMPF